MKKSSNTNNKTCILITGMHRSGTSFLAKYIHTLGITAGKDLMPASFDNPYGFFEHNKVVSINDKILKHLDAQWDQPFINYNKIITPYLIDFLQTELRSLINLEFSDEKTFFVKDPRASLLLPIWLKVLEELNIDTKIIICNRDPMAIANSLYKRNQFTISKSLFLYNSYTLIAEKYSRETERIFFNFSNDLNQLNKSDKLIHAFLKTYTISSHVNTPIVDLFDKNLSHSEVEEKYIETPYSNLSTKINLAILKYPKLKSENYKLFNKLYDTYLDQKANLEGWLRKTYTGKIVLYKKNSPVPIKIINGTVKSGQNLISIDLNYDEQIDSIIFYPIDHSCICNITSCQINENEVSWSPKSGQIIDGLIYFNVAYPSVEIDYKGNVDHVSISFTISDLSSDISRLIEIRTLNNKITRLNSDFAQYKKEKKTYINQLKEQLELLNLISETDEKESYSIYQKALQALNQSHEQLSNSIQDKLNNLTISHQKVIQDYKKELNILKLEFDNSKNEWQFELTEEKTKYNKLNSEYSAKIEQHTKELEKISIENEKYQKQIENISAENKKYRKQIENISVKNNKNIKQLEYALLENEKNEKTISLMKIEQEEIENKNKNQSLIVHNQHKEILQFKEDYKDRERELNDISNSTSYLIGRIITWPLRMIYEGINNFQPALKVFLGVLSLLIIAPIHFFRSLTFQNFKTLWNALRYEHPTHILHNVRKKLGLPSKLSKLSKLSNQKFNNPITRKRVLYISPNLPDYDGSSGGRRATKLISLLCETCTVYVFTLGARPEKYRDKLNSIGAIVIDSNLHEEIYKCVSDVDSIIFAWYYSLHDNAAILKHYNNPQIIVDSVDVHWIREERSIGQVPGITQEGVAQNKHTEIESYKHADIIWVVSEEDKTAVLKEIPEATILVLSNIHEIEVTRYSEPQTNNILFLGGYNHPPNITAANILVKEILPELRKSIPSATLLLAGANAPKQIISLGEHEGVEFLGFIPEEELPGLYKKSLITAAPLTAGAGIKGKLCEAIAYRLPVITTDIGNEGINLIHGIDGFITSVDQMVAPLIKIIERKYDLAMMTSKAQDKLMSIVGPDRARMRIRQSLFPAVSICIVTWNRLELVKRCIESIEKHTEYPSYNILVHSNGCTDGTQEYLEAACKINERIIPILSENNDVFVKPNNAMMQMFPNNDVVLLNNDTMVTSGWLEGLRITAYSNPDIGIVGSKILYPDGRLQEFGSELYENGTGRNIGKWDDPDKLDYQKAKYVGYVSGCSMYIKRSTIDQIGYFDEQFHPCYCEDSDYAYTAWENDIRTMVTPKSIIYHDEGGTSGKDESSGFKRYQKVNFEKFLGKHGQSLHRISELITNLNYPN